MNTLLNNIKVEKFQVNQCEECTHILYDTDSREAVIIDCGVYYENERRRFLNFIEQNNLRPVRLLLTHAHHDHVCGNDLVYERFGLLPEVHEADRPLMTGHLLLRIDEFYNHHYPYPIPMPEHYLTDGEIIQFGNHVLKVIHTPGHSPGSVFFYCEKAGIAFSGDTLFCRDIGRTNLPFGSEIDIINSLDYITHLLPDDTVILPGHGKKSTIGDEKLFNSQLEYPLF